MILRPTIVLRDTTDSSTSQKCSESAMVTSISPLKTALSSPQLPDRSTSNLSGICFAAQMSPFSPKTSGSTMATSNSATARSYPPKLLSTPIHEAETHFYASTLSNWLVFRLVRLCNCIRRAPSRYKVSKVNIFATIALGLSRPITLCCYRVYWNLTLTR